MEDLVKSLAKVRCHYKAASHSCRISSIRRNIFIRDFLLLLPQRPNLAHFLPFLSSQRGIEDVNVDSDHGGHTLHLVSES